MRRTAEFDAFGPWVDEVRTGAQLPRLYRGAGIDPAAHRLVLKIPRAIERRNANPDMHLYDFLIAVGDHTVTVLRRQDDFYDRAQIPVGQLVAIEDSISLLDGRLTLHTADGAATVISYNCPDPAPVRRLLGLLRHLYLPRGSSGLPAAGSSEPVSVRGLADDDAGLVTAYRQVLEAEPGMRLIGAAPRVALGSALDRMGRALRLARPVTLHATVTLADDRELQLLHRRDRITRGHDKVHSIARTVLPRARITGVRTRPHEQFPQVTVVSVHSEDAALDFPLHTGPETDALVALLRP